MLPSNVTFFIALQSSYCITGRKRSWMPNSIHTRVVVHGEHILLITFATPKSPPCSVAFPIPFCSACFCTSLWDFLWWRQPQKSTEVLCKIPHLEELHFCGQYVSMYVCMCILHELYKQINCLFVATICGNFVICALVFIQQMCYADIICVSISVSVSEGCCPSPLGKSLWLLIKHICFFLAVAVAVYSHIYFMNDSPSTWSQFIDCLFLSSTLNV